MREFFFVSTRISHKFNQEIIGKLRKGNHFLTVIRYRELLRDFYDLGCAGDRHLSFEILQICSKFRKFAENLWRNFFNFSLHANHMINSEWRDKENFFALFLSSQRKKSDIEERKVQKR